MDFHPLRLSFNLEQLVVNVEPSRLHVEAKVTDRQKIAVWDGAEGLLQPCETLQERELGRELRHEISNVAVQQRDALLQHLRGLIRSILVLLHLFGQDEHEADDEGESRKFLVGDYLPVLGQYMVMNQVGKHGGHGPQRGSDPETKSLDPPTNGPLRVLERGLIRSGDIGPLHTSVLLRIHGQLRSRREDKANSGRSVMTPSTPQAATWRWSLGVTAP